MYKIKNMFGHFVYILVCLLNQEWGYNVLTIGIKIRVNGGGGDAFCIETHCILYMYGKGGLTRIYKMDIFSCCVGCNRKCYFSNIYVNTFTQCSAMKRIHKILIWIILCGGYAYITFCALNIYLMICFFMFVLMNAKNICHV